MEPSCLTCFNLQAWPSYRHDRFRRVRATHWARGTGFGVNIHKPEYIYESAQTCETCALIVEALVAVEGSTVVDWIIVHRIQGDVLKLQYAVNKKSAFNIIELFTVQGM